METKTEKAFFERLQRIESRVVRGFTELGVTICDEDEWIRVDTEHKVAFVKGLGKSIRAIQLAILKAGGYAGSTYEVYAGGVKAGTVEVWDFNKG